jgi:hypothetical protein
VHCSGCGRLLAGDKLPNQVAAMSLGAIPDYQQAARQMTQQVREKVHHLWGADGLSVKPEIKVPRDASDGREHLPVEMILQHRGLSARGPGAHPMGPLAQSLSSMKTMVRRSPSAFLSRGQRTRFQYRIVSSSRSSARPVGRWQLHPSWRRMRQT